MKQQKKLLLAGLAIVPLALSSWNSNTSESDFRNSEKQQTFSQNETIGEANVVVVQSKVNKKTMLDVTDKFDLGPSQEKVVITTKTLDPSNALSIEDIVKTYQ
ncbi:hypothetical protein [Chryseobacterium sp. CH21]|uniref:hypothetical protein n=1 Tax=Chryseobacterium sp. CH21 TaxID=713556 RepID=UPI00100BB6BE|nr:hypothetical protein [Chryseobacterium sp. CH21]